MVELLTRATLLSSQHDCRYGVYRMSGRNARYLEAALTGLKASKVAGVPEGYADTAAARREIALLALYSETFSGKGESALETGQAMLKNCPASEQVWVRLALVEAARTAWRADVVDAQLQALSQSPPQEPLSRFLVESYWAERRAQLQPPNWAQARSWHDQAWRYLGAAGASSTWPTGSGHFLAQALSAWSEILTQAARTPTEVAQAQQLRETDLAGYAQDPNPEVMQAWIFERLNRLAEARSQHDWDLCDRELARVQTAIEWLKSESERESHKQIEQVEKVAGEIAGLAAQDKNLGGRGLEIMGQNLKPSAVTSGELSRLECSFYREWARVLIYAPEPTPQRLKKARLCLQLSSLRQAMNILTQSPLATVDAPLFDMVELELLQREPGWEQRAADGAAQGVSFFESHPSGPGLVSALTVLGEVQLARGQESAARASLQRAVDRAEEHVRGFGYTGVWADRFRQRYRRAYEILLGLEVDHGHSVAAADLLSRFQQLQIAALRQDSFSARATSTPLPRLRGANQPLEDTLPPPVSGSTASSTVAHGKGQFFQALNGLRKLHPEYESMLAVRPVNYAQLQKLIPKDVAVLQFFPSADTLYLFFVSASDFKIQKVAIGSEEVRRRVSAFRRQALDPSSRAENVEKASQNLYQCLISPLEKELAPFSTLAFVPTGALSYVPFQALGHGGEDGHFHYLVESKACIALLKSADLELLGHPPAPAPGALLALGNPDGTLPSAEKEASQVAGLFEGSHSYAGSAASRDKLEPLPAGTRLLHLATHGCLDGNHPDQSYLMLASHGRLCVSDVYALSLPEVRLVTLSACQTALAQSNPGSEITSLADAFEVAGASSVVATLWSVDDEATRQLMLAFYAHVKEGKSLVEALRAAQLQLLNNPRYHSPFYWAAFSLYGDWR